MMAKLVLNCHVNTHYQSIVKLVENGSLQFSAGHFLTFPRCPIKGLDSGDKPGQGLWEFPGMGEPSYRWKKMTLFTPPATLNDMFPFIFNGRLSTSGNMSDSDRWRQNVSVSSDGSHATKVQKWSRVQARQDRAPERFYCDLTVTTSTYMDVIK